jgi:hypothetical protein
LLRKYAVDKFADSGVNGESRVERRGEVVEHQSIDGVVEQGDLSSSPGQARCIVECDILLERSLSPRSECRGDSGSSGSLEPQLEQRSGHIRVSAEPSHDISQVVGEAYPVGRPGITGRDDLGIRCESLSDAVNECGDEIVAGREVIRRGAARRACCGVDSSVGKTAGSFLSEHADPGIGESGASFNVAGHDAHASQTTTAVVV